MAKKPEPNPAESGSPSGAESPSPAAPVAPTLPFGGATFDASLLGAVDVTIQTDLAGARSGWSQRIHARFLARLAKAFDWNQPKAAGLFAALIQSHGAGGNASQFRQWLESAAPGPARLDAAQKVGADLADL